MKRFVAVLTIITIVLSFCVIPAYADPPWSEGGNGVPPGLHKQNKVPPGLARKAFEDADEMRWAQRAIEKLKSKGLVKGRKNGLYDPRGNVTKLEAVIMALRVMGWEDLASNFDFLPANYSGESVGEWAYGYINVACEKGILDDVDMMYFEPGEPALRHEVAKYVIRALGYEEEALGKMDGDLPFTDASLVPSGSIGYVYLVYDFELMIGNNGRFNPLGTLTRAEMAVLFERLDNKVDSDVTEEEIKGETVKLYADSIKIETETGTELFYISQDVIVYDHDDRIPYIGIQDGSYVLMVLQDGLVVYIEVMDRDDDEDKILYKYKGTVVYADEESGELCILDKRLKLVFEITDGTVIVINGNEEDLGSVRAGDTAQIRVDFKNRAREIEIERENRQETEGIITALDLSGIYHITVSDNVYGGTRYRLSGDAEVTVDNDEASLEDLIVGMSAELTLDDKTVIKVSAENTELEFEAEIVSIGDVTITVLTEDDTKVTYYLSEDVIIVVDDEDDSNVGINDL